MKHDPEQRIDEFEVAAITNLSVHTLRGYRVRRIGPLYRKLGRRVIYRRGDVTDWLEHEEAPALMANQEGA